MSAIFERIDLLRFLIIGKLKIGQKEMMLGYLWWILDPLLLMFVYWLLVRVIFKRGTADYPLFLVCALVPWRAFSVSLSQSVSSISDKFSLLNAVNFPRIFLPLANVIANHIKLLFGLLVVLGFTFFYHVSLSFRIIYLIIPFVFQFLIVCGLSMFLSVFGVYFRDLKNLIQFILRVWLYLSPVLYSLDRIPPRLHLFFLLNPIASVIVMYRDIFMNRGGLELRSFIILSIETTATLIIGYTFFRIHEKRFLKML